MAHWLLKEEPTHYAYSDLVRDGRTDWSGVHNALALKHLRSMRPGDQAIYYHSGDERACVGIVRIASTPRPDPADDRGSWTVEVRPVRALPAPVPLAVLRGDPVFAGFDLLRISRLSILPVPDRMWARILALAGGTATATRRDRARGSARPTRGPAATRRS